MSGPGIFDDFFRTAKKSAFHVETKDSYSVSSEDDALRRFAAGEPPPTERPAAFHAWNGLIQETTGRGVSVARVRVVSVPHTTYVRWLMSVTDRTIANGEQVRWLPRNLAADSGHVPMDDYWVFDREMVVFNTTDPAGGTTGVAVTTDPEIVALCAGSWDRLWGLGIDHSEYIESEFAAR
ncbi:hypothetical protein HLB23_29615 [Nocardia uniformis]|uniref:DUF6879 domain-containing protein n=1 Tax=Nocardia uniformis TaxID=53432 RepID=A0A849C5G3_9NOCA|nr:DUF6879 family protein [Nocardia uniformis]NNH73963.1 hypothetical protein [Nocardia uniformis]